MCNRHKTFHYENIYCYDIGKHRFSMKYIKFHFFRNVHNIHISGENEVLFIHFIGYHMANSVYEN